MWDFVFQFQAGILNTLTVFGISCFLGTAIGLLTAVLNKSRDSIVGMVVRGYVNLVRGVPELLIVLIIYFGGTAAVSSIAGGYVEVNALSAGVAALAVVFGGFSAEIFRGAIQAIPEGQHEAAKSLGLSRSQIWIKIIIPQMVPLALPAYANLCISLIKETSLISVIGLIDIMRVAYVGAGSMRAPLPFYLAASAIYLALTSIALLCFHLIERQHAASLHRI